MKRGIVLAAALFMLLAPSARADTHTFLNPAVLYPIGGAGELGPANRFPSTISVSGLPGTVTKVTATLIGYGSSYPGDADIALRGPNGQTVMLLSDTCGPAAIADNGWTFDDASPSFLSAGGACPNEQTSTYTPSDWPPADDFSPSGGPAPPYQSSLSALAGGSPNGSWSLFAFDDNGSGGFVGFDFSGWALTLEVQPPPPAAATTAALPTATTGQRAAALAKCKKKKKGKKRKKCQKQAALLPA